MLPDHTVCGVPFNGVHTSVKMGVLDKAGNLNMVFTPGDKSPYVILQIRQPERTADAVDWWKSKWQGVPTEGMWLDASEMMADMIESDAFKKEVIVARYKDIPLDFPCAVEVTVPSFVLRCPGSGWFTHSYGDLSDSADACSTEHVRKCVDDNIALNGM
jgi:hypothetical protein